MGEKDITEKTLEAYNDVFADIVNGLLFSGEIIVKEEDLIDAQPYSMYKADGKIHGQDRDVSKYWEKADGTGVSLKVAFLGIENQTNYDEDMPLRVISYDGAHYRAQLGQDIKYPVVTLVLYFGDKAWGKNRSLYDCIEIPENLKSYVNNYKINLFEIARLPQEAIQYFHSDFKIVVDYFIQKHRNKKYNPSKQTIKHVEEILELFRVLTGDTRFEDILNDNPEGGVHNMCEILDQVEARGIAIGEARGEARGVAIGEAKGINKLAALIDQLISLGRLEDIQKAAKDEDYRADLFKEFQIL